MKNYSAIIIDLIKSRSYSVNDRTAIQNHIIAVINQLNDVFAHVIARKVEFSAGDEVQGLFTSPQAAFLYFRMFNMFISPVDVRAGIGVGEWSIKVENASTTAQDGPAYHNARRAIEEVKNSLGYSVLLYSGNENDIFINSAINTSFILTSNQSEYQNELMLLFELLYPIDAHKIINPQKMHLLSDLVTTKNKLNYYTYFKKSRTVKKYPFDAIQYLNIEACPIDAINDDSTFYVSSGKKRGLPMQLSDILGITRQSIEKTFKTANIYAVRSSAVVALKLIDRYL